MEDGRSILLKNGRLVGGGRSFISDILISGGRIAAMAGHIEPEPGTRVIDVAGCMVTYGLADVHVHFREPGFSAKETIDSGARAAAHGGYTTVCTMPNLSPAPDSVETLGVQLDMICYEKACIEVLPFATITRGRKGGGVVDMAALKGSVAGFSDDGSGVQDAGVMEEAMRLALKEDTIISAHCEDTDEEPFGPESEWMQVARDTEMAARIGCRYHVCHVSTAESVEAVRRAKAAGARVSCETGPHYLTLTQEDRLAHVEACRIAADYGANCSDGVNGLEGGLPECSSGGCAAGCADVSCVEAKPEHQRFAQDDCADCGRFRMNPPLRTPADRDALIRGIQDGTVEVIATDHAPHTAEEKSRGYYMSAMGIVGLETAFAVLYTRLVREGVITLEKLVELMCDNPRRIFRLGGGLKVGERADIAVFNLDDEYVIDSASFLSKGRSTPFEGWKVRGRCILTLKDGIAVYDEVGE